MLSEQEARQRPDKKLFVSAGSTAAVPLRIRHIFVTGATGSATKVVMPNVNEAEGLFFTVTGLTAAATSTAGITVDYSDGNPSATISTSIVTSGVDLELYSNGRDWVITR